MQDRMIIANSQAAAIFSSARQRLIVQSLISSELSLGSLARIAKMPMSLLQYHVLKCIAAGLVEVVREQRRAGRAIKYYRATAQSFFVPITYITTLPGTSLARTLRELLDQNLANTLSGVEFSHDGQNPHIVLKKDMARRAAAIEFWLDLSLGKDDAEEVFASLKAVADRFRDRACDKGARFLVHLAAAKV